MKRSLYGALLASASPMAILAIAGGCLIAGGASAGMVFNGDESTLYYSASNPGTAVLPSPVPTWTSGGGCNAAIPTAADCTFITRIQPHYGVTSFQINGHTVTMTPGSSVIKVDNRTIVTIDPHTVSGIDFVQEQYVIPFVNATNQAAAVSGANGASLNALSNYSGTNTAMQALASAVNSLTSTADIQKAGAQLRPEVNGGTTQASLGATNQALGTIQIRSDGVRTAAADQTGISSGETLRGLGVWGQGFGSYASQDRRQDVDGYTAGTYGLAFGADARVLDAVRVGASFAYARTNVDDTGSRDGSGQKINSYIGSLYGTYTANSWYVDGALTYGRHDYDATRVVNFTGAPQQVAKASFAGQQYGAKAEFGYPLSVGPAVVTPLVSIAYNRLNQDGYTETGAAGANLTVGSSSADSVRSGLGGKVSTTIAQAGEWNIKPNARAIWLHEFNGSAPDQTSTYVAGGSSFTTSGITVAQEHFNLGVGLDVASVRNTTVSAKYDADLSDRYVSHTGSLQVRTEF